MRTRHVVILGSSLLASRLVAAAPPDADEALLAREARLDVVLRLVAGRNPEVLESRERAAAAAARAGGAGALPDLELKGELWGVPLLSPLAFDRANTIMVGLRQTFPALGTRAAQARMAAEEAGTVAEAERARLRDLTTQARRAYADYFRADHEYRVHLEHAGLLSHLVELSRAHYQSGHGSQQDVLRLSLELSELHADVADIEQQRRSARALLNTLMGRPPDAPLGPAPELSQADLTTPRAGEADRRPNVEARPELAAGVRAVRRDEAALDLARRSARWPAVMVGADYWYTPTLPDPHGYGAMVAINLPWWSGRRDGAVREAEHALAADARALEAQRNAAAFEREDAAAKVAAARSAFAILDASVLPDARRNFESTRAAYEAGQGTALGMIDALRSYWNVQLQRGRALARLQISLADYDRVAP